jgi:hypothetical protein
MTIATNYYRVVARHTGRRNGTYLPGPPRHAIRPDDETVLCGAPVDDLMFFDLPYQELDPVMRCSDCSVAFDRLTSGL